MPGMRWKINEIRSLKRQARDGWPLEQIKIEGRSKLGVRYKLFELGIYFVRWSANEIRYLKKSTMAGMRPWEIEIEGRSKIAIRNKCLRAGFWKPKPHILRPWTLGEIRKLRHLVEEVNYTAKSLISNGYFSGRSKDSISQQMRRSKIRRQSSVRK